ncbi:MAG: 2OG-Fe(II) oxygenase [Candidatus Sericytochromatia bacterium]|nr:2OG-Fe(II) oxygenase [Candidatus Sericytochromatia bacterium]
MLPPEALSAQGLLYVKRQFLTLAECQQLVSDLHQSEHAPSLTYYAHSGPVVDASYRSTREINVSRHVRDQVVQKLIVLHQEMQDYFQLQFVNMEGLQFLSYQPGDFFKAHRDNHSSPNPLAERKLSLLLFLNAPKEALTDSLPAELYDYEGGLLVFYRPSRRPPYQPVGMPLQVAPGMLIGFRPDVLHEVTPVISGQRFTIVTWLS